MRKLWLIFSQATTVALAVLLIVSTLRPDLLPSRDNGGGIVTIRESGGRPANVEAARAATSYSVAARKAMPSVVNIFTSKEMKVPRHPFMDDPRLPALLRRSVGKRTTTGFQPWLRRNRGFGRLCVDQSPCHRGSGRHRGRAQRWSASQSPASRGRSGERPGGAESGSRRICPRSPSGGPTRST